MVVRLKDIAAELGVSVVTVSRALRDRPDIAEETKAKILDRVKRLNYRPNLTARSLVTGRSSLIGLVVPDLIHPFFAEIAKGLSAKLREKDYFLIVSSSESDPQLEQDEIEHMLAHHLDCFVVASCQKEPDSLRKFGDAGVPLVLIDRSFPRFPCHFVGVDDYEVGELATEHLIAQGCKRIAHIRGPVTNVGNRRAEGYRAALEKHGMGAPENYVVACGEASDSDGETRGRRAMEEILALKPRPDGIFCFNDTVAVGAMDQAFEAGLKIPKHIAIVGCGNFHYSSKLQVPLTSVDQRSREIGERTAKMIMTLLEKPPSARPRTVILKPELIARESSRIK
ncbi:Transcriptional regulator [Candidatus Sulfotelmatomonas gaucii]|uniref:Transcriptional regulator n=1 Tax=Candidatus Sulfuritelmatomonas gaucii TaxID=2043161 RepID=A0A2N9L6C8_9BACT|nr:Transcriptional regulator [Candidatus Sulfotelmatomonas gaucii]